MNAYNITTTRDNRPMERTQLKFHALQQVSGADDMSVLLLTDVAQRRLLSVICDKATAKQFNLRINNEMSRLMLPEALLQVADAKLEMLVVGLYDGQYQVMLSNTKTGASTRVRMSDAVLLSAISDTPLYIEERLMEKQSMPFDAKATQVAIPINTMDRKSLQAALKHAVEEENYELASHIRDEINNREKSE